jgi:glycosyltransferase involved in cell wall biosynthesis
MHIALVSTSCVPVPPLRYGGTELVIAELASALVALGHQVTTFATGDSHPAGILRACFDRAHWPPDPYRDLVHAHHACRELQKGVVRADVVHVHTGMALPFAHDLDAPVIHTVHHQREESLAEFYRYFRNTEYVMISARQSALHPELEHRRVIHHGLDPARYRLGPGTGGYVAFLGRLAREKGPDVAIDAAQMARVPIRLAGEAHAVDRDFAARELRPRLARPGVQALGEADHAQKLALLGDARALLFPIDWEEPFGLVMIEAMLCGTPVIAFPRGSVPEVVEHGVTGFLVHDAADMARAISAAAALDRRAIRRRAEERWSHLRMAREHLEAYADCIRRHPSERGRSEVCARTSVSAGHRA